MTTIVLSTFDALEEQKMEAIDPEIFDALHIRYRQAVDNRIKHRNQIFNLAYTLTPELHN